MTENFTFKRPLTIEYGKPLPETPIDWSQYDHLLVKGNVLDPEGRMQELYFEAQENHVPVTWKTEEMGKRLDRLQ